MRFRAFCLLSLLMVLIPQVVFAQPYVLWSKSYGDPSRYDWAYSIAVAVGGDILLCGTRSSLWQDYTYRQTYRRMYVIRTDPQGDVRWSELYFGEADFSRGSDIIPTPDGGSLAAGHGEVYPEYDDFLLVRHTAGGGKLWHGVYGDNSTEGRSVAETPDGDYIVTGESSPLTLLKVDSLGNEKWERYIPGYSIGNSIAVTSDSGYAIAGYSGSNHCLVRTDSDGDLLWSKLYGQGLSDYRNSLATTPDGGFIIAGNDDDWVDSDFYVVRTDSAGETLWTRTYGDPDYREYCYSVAVLPDSGYLLTGEKYIPSFESARVYVIRTDAEGDTIWTWFRDHMYGRGYAGTVAPDGGYLVAGSTGIPGTHYDDVYLTKLVDELPDMIVTLAPDATTVERGGSLGYTIEVTNNSDTDQRFEYWSDVYLWTGDPYSKNPVFGPRKVMVKSGRTRSGHLDHKVPGDAPLKTFTLCGRIGSHPEGV